MFLCWTNFFFLLSFSIMKQRKIHRIFGWMQELYCVIEKFFCLKSKKRLIHWGFFHFINRQLANDYSICASPVFFLTKKIIGEFAIIDGVKVLWWDRKKKDTANPLTLLDGISWDLSWRQSNKIDNLRCRLHYYSHI